MSFVNGKRRSKEIFFLELWEWYYLIFVCVLLLILNFKISIFLDEIQRKNYFGVETESKKISSAIHFRDIRAAYSTRTKEKKREIKTFFNVTRSAINISR